MTTMTVIEAIHARRATRSFLPDRVDEQAIRTLLDAAVHAPTAIHLEPWAFVIVQDPATLKRYSDRAKTLVAARLHHDPHATGAKSEGHLELMLKNPSFNIFYDAGTLIAICGRALGAYVAADCWLAAENLMLAACSMGLATCPIGFAVDVLNHPEIKFELAIPDDVTVVAPIIVGVPRTVLPAVSRKDPVILRWSK